MQIKLNNNSFFEFILVELDTMDVWDNGVSSDAKTSTGGGSVGRAGGRAGGRASGDSFLLAPPGLVDEE